jgi:4-amino-4-deoxychorismate lyase
MYIYLNGSIIKEEQASISIYDHGFMYGLGLFETFRVYQGHPFLLYDHLKRLRKGLDELHIKWDVSDEEIVASLKQLLIKNELQDAYIRLNISAGSGGLGLITDPYINPTTIIYIKPLPSMVKEKEGVILHTTRNTPEGQRRLKSHHYLNNIIGKREVGQAPWKEGIFLTKDGYVAEGIVSNIFWVKGQNVYTPHLDTGILEGVTRGFVIKMLEKANISIDEGFYGLDELLGCDEVFVTNSIQEIVPLNKVGNKTYPGVKGQIARKLKEQYDKLKLLLLSTEAIERFDSSESRK